MEMMDFAKGGYPPEEDSIAAILCIAACAIFTFAGGVSFYILMELLR